MMSNNFFIPYHLLEEVLVRLPAELLLQLKLVSATWSALISSKGFSQKHLKYSRMAPEEDAQSTKVIIRTFDIYEVEWRKSFKLLTTNLDSSVDFLRTGKEINHPLQEYNEIPIKMVGSCHGLVCIRNSYDGLFLYNPCINKHSMLPHSQSGRRRPLTQGSSVYGFGYDDVQNDFKVIRFVPSEKVLEIYSLKYNSWKIINMVFINILNRSHSGVFVNSHVHWLYLTANHVCIAAIDLKTYEFRSMKLPSTVNYNKPINLGVLNGWLTLFRMSSMLAAAVEVWVMKHHGKDENWTLLATIPFGELLTDTYFCGLRIRPDEEITR